MLWRCSEAPALQFPRVQFLGGSKLHFLGFRQSMGTPSLMLNEIKTSSSYILNKRIRARNCSLEELESFKTVPKCVE